MTETYTAYYTSPTGDTGTTQVPAGSPPPAGYSTTPPAGNYDAGGHPTGGQTSSAQGNAPAGYMLGSIPSIGNVWMQPDPNNVGGGKIVDPNTGQVINYQVDAMGHYEFSDPETGEVIGTNIGAGQGTQFGYPTNVVPTQLKVPTAVDPSGVGRIPTIPIPTVIEPIFTPPDLTNLQSQIDAATERYNSGNYSTQDLLLSKYVDPITGGYNLAKALNEGVTQQQLVDAGFGRARTSLLAATMADYVMLNDDSMISKDAFNSLSPDAQAYIMENGIEAYNAQFPATEGEYVQLDNGEAIPLKSTKDDAGNIISIGFEDLPIDQQQYLKVKGIEAFNKEYNAEVDADSLRLYLDGLGGDIDTYNGLETDAEKEVYLTDLHDAKIANYINIAGGSIDTYNTLADDIQKQDYLQGLQDVVEAKHQKYQEDLQVVQRYVNDGQINVDESGNYNFSGLGTKYLDNPALASALQNLFKDPETGETIDIEKLKMSYPSYLQDYSQMTPAMIEIAKNEGIRGLSIADLDSSKEIFERLQSYGLRAWNEIYTGETENYIPSYQELQDAGITLEQWKSFIEASGGNYRVGMPSSYTKEGNLTIDDINYWKGRGWGFIERNNKDMAVSIQVPTGIQHVNPAAIQSIINDKYEGLNWNDLNDTQQTNVLTEYYQPSWHEQWIATPLKTALSTFEATGQGDTEKIESIFKEGELEYTPYKSYVGMQEVITPITGMEAWAKRQSNPILQLGASGVAAVVGLVQGAKGMVDTAAKAVQQIVQGNPLQATGTFMTIPLGIGEYVAVELPRQVVADPVYGAGQVLGLFVLPEVVKGGIRNIRASFRNVGPLGATSRAYVTETGIPFYGKGPYQTDAGFLSAMADLQKKARENPNRVVFSEVIVEIPKFNAEGRYTKIGDSYVIEGTKETANNFVGRDSMAHPSANLYNSAIQPMEIRDTAKALISRVLPDGTIEWVVGKDRAGYAYELFGGDLATGKGKPLSQLLKELQEEIGLKPEDIISIEELPPYLGKLHPYALNGGRVWKINVRPDFEVKKLAKGEEIVDSKWIRDDSTVRVNGSTWDLLKGAGVKVGTGGFGIIAKAGERLADATRDKTWGDRVGKTVEVDRVKVGDEGSLYKKDVEINNNAKPNQQVRYSQMTDELQNKAVEQGKSYPEGTLIEDAQGLHWIKQKVGNDPNSSWQRYNLKEGKLEEQVTGKYYEPFKIDSNYGANITARSKVVHIPTEAINKTKVFKEGRMPTEAEIQATALKQKPFKIIFSDRKTPANIQTPLRESHFTSDYTAILDSIKDGKWQIDTGGKYKEFYMSGKPTPFFSQRSMSRGEPVLHKPALVNIDFMPEDFIKHGQQLKVEWGGPIAQYVIKIINHRIENEKTAIPTTLETYKPNWQSKVIAGGVFKDITASSLTDYSGPTVPVKLTPKVVEITGAVTKLKDIRKVVFDLDGTLVDGKGKVRPYAFELLDHLKANNIDIALWTHSPYARTAAILNNTGLNRYFNIGEPRVGGIGKVRQAGVTELNKTMGINENVKVREDYAKANEVDKFKNIAKINGDILIDNSGKQIREQARRGNVALKTTTYYGGKSYDLARIQELLSGEPMRKVETQGFDVVERGTQYTQGQSIPVIYFQSEAFKLATEELGKKNTIEAKVGEKGELYSGGELTDFIRDKAILRGKSLPNGIRLQDTTGKVWEKVGSIWASVDKTGAIGREFASINSLDGANIVARSVVVNVPTYLKDLRTGIKNAKPESLSEVWENTMDIPNRAINETINKVGDVRKAGEVELSKEMGTLVEGQPFKNPYLVSAKSLYALKGVMLKENVRDILTGKVRPKPIGFSWKGSGDSPFRNVGKAWGLKTEGLDKWGGKGAKESARPKFKSEAEEAIYKDKVDAGIIKEKPVSGEPMPEHMLEGFGTQGFGEGGKGIWGDNVIESNPLSGSKTSGVPESVNILGEAKTVVFDLDGTLVRMSSDWTGVRATIRPNVIELLDYLQANDRKIGLWTHSTFERANTILKNTGLDKYFDIKNKDQVRTRYDYAEDTNPSAYKNIGELGEKAVLIDDLAAQIEQQKTKGNYAIKTSTYYGAKSNDMVRILDEFKKADEVKIKTEASSGSWIKSETPSRYNNMSPREYAEEYSMGKISKDDLAAQEYRFNNKTAVEAELQNLYTESKPKTEGASISEQQLEERGIPFDIDKELADLQRSRPKYIVNWDTITTIDTNTSGNIKLGGAGHIENGVLKGVHITRTPDTVIKVLNDNKDIGAVEQPSIEGGLQAKGLYFSDIPKEWDKIMARSAVEGTPRIEVPIEVTGKFADITKYDGFLDKEFIDTLKEKGYDGILDRGGGRTDGAQVVVWNTNAVKRFGEWRNEQQWKEYKPYEESVREKVDKDGRRLDDEGYGGGKYKIGLREPLGALLISGADNEYNRAKEADNSEIAKANDEIARAMESDRAEMAKYQEEIARVSGYKEEVPLKEQVSEEMVATETYPEEGVSEEIATEEAYKEEPVSEEVATESTYPEEGAIEKTYPEEAVVESSYAPEEAPPEGGYPNEYVPTYEGYGEGGGGTGGGGIILGSGGNQLTKEQLEGAIGWKQGIMFKYIYPPYGQEDIINSRTPIQGIPIKEGIRSAYETIIRTRKGFIPPNITREMGMMTLVITDADKNGQPEIKFIEREVRKGRGAVTKKKIDTAQAF